MNAKTARREVAINEVVRDAVSRATGARTVVERAGDADEHWLGIEENWAVQCLSHSTVVGVDTRHDAWIVAANPQNFCGECGKIANGDAPKVVAATVAA